MKLSVLFAGHAHPWEELLDLVHMAEELGFAAAYVDGDICMLDSSREAEVLDGWTVTTALLARTERIAIGSIRLVHYWNAARLAQMTATAERLAPGRLRFFISIGDRPNDERFGLPRLSPAERIRWLDETLCAVRALWRGESVTQRGRYVALDRARVHPGPPGGRMPIAIAARRRKLLEVVATHADVWDVNLPPLADRVDRAAAQLEAACRVRKRNPNEISRSMLIFTRVRDASDAASSLKEYRQLNPWFHWIPDEELTPALVVGSGRHCRSRLEELAGELRLEHPVIDLTGLDAAASRRVLGGLS